MKKKLNTKGVINELTGQSAFFKDPPAVSESEETVRDVRSGRNEKRETKRHPFDIYRDQLESLQEMKLASMRSGSLKSMSEMVRAALDAYIEKNG